MTQEQDAHDLALYRYAMYCGLDTLVRHVAYHGRGWYHFIEGDLVVALEVVL